MNDMIGFFPTWYVPNFGSGNVVAVIAASHVLFSHMSVGASFLLAFLATIAYKQNREEIYPFIKKYIFGLLITSYIVGSITGPGIWYSTTVASPRGLSALIHTFVWEWAAEYLWFVTEVVLVYILYYIMDKVDRKTFMRLTWIFALGSMMTLFIIVGILSFMLSVGNPVWYTSGAVVDSFFNKNYFPHVMMRATFMIALAGLMGLAISTRIKDYSLKKNLTQYMSLWGMGGIIFGSIFFVWYLATLPDRATETLSMAISPFFKNSIAGTIAVVAVFFLAAYLWPKIIKSATMIGAMMIGILFLAIYPEEKIRETLRKPYIAGDFIWVNQIVAKDVPAKGVKSEINKIDQNGLLKLNPFVPEKLKTNTSANQLERGAALTMLQCSACHSIDPAGTRPLVQKFNGVTNPNLIYHFLETRLSGDPSKGAAPYMPKFVGTEEDKRAISAYLANLEKDYMASTAKTNQSAQASTK